MGQPVGSGVQEGPPSCLRGHHGLLRWTTGRVPSVRAEPDCIFCGIVAGEISSTTIAESEKAIAFMDINPVTHGHALVAPRSHATDLFDVTTDDLAACVHLAQQIARRAKNRLGADGVNLLNCSGEAARQTVFHFHIHVIPRFNGQPGKDAVGLPWESVPSNPDEIERFGNLLS
jgi:histidine triad (HIT) family protein